MCYEIYLNNLSSTQWTVQQIDVTNQDSGYLQTVQGSALDGVIFHPSRSRDSKGGAPAADIAPGESVIAYMWVAIAKNAPAPSQLLHKIALKRMGDDKVHDIGAPATAVLTQLPQIASPLRGQNWVAANGPSNQSAHRRALIILDGSSYIAQRYAIDWVKADATGNTYQGDVKDNHKYYCFGVEALAVADAVVTEVKDGIPENVPDNTARAVPITLETVAGNHVILDLGGGVYAMYAHLQPASIRVKLGDKVTNGQVVGLVGNTGNSSEPHLHFQLMNRNSPLGSEGLPYALASFKLTGHVTGEQEKAAVSKLATPETHTGDMPLEDEARGLRALAASYRSSGRSFRFAAIKAASHAIGTPQQADGNVSADPRPQRSEAHVDPVARVADHREGRQQIPHTAECRCRNPPPRRHRRREHDVHRIGCCCRCNYS